MKALAAPCSSSPDPGPAPGLAQVAPVAAPEPAVIGWNIGKDGFAAVAICSLKDGKVVLHGFRHMRLGFGLGGGFAG